MSKYTSVPQEFDDWADTLDQDVITYAHEFPFEGYEMVLDEITRRTEIGPGAAVLDLGIGTGNLAARFLAAGCQVYGLDFSSKMLAVARAKFPQIRLAQADLLGDWPAVLAQAFDRQQFDCIVSAYTFHHFDLGLKIDLLTRLASAHLSPGGRMVIGDIAFATAAAQEQAHQDEEDYWIADETLAACHKAGLPTSFIQISSCAGVFTFRPESLQAAP